MPRSTRILQLWPMLTTLGLMMLGPTSCLTATDGHPGDIGSGAASDGGWSTGGYGNTSTGGANGGGSGGTAGTGGGIIVGGTGGRNTGGTAGSSGGTAGTGGTFSTNPCIYFPFTTSWGLACGANLTSTADPRRLYLCDGTTTAGSVVCQSGCYAAPVGEADYCYGTDPCINNPFNGEACGSNLAPYAVQYRMYNCSGQRTLSYYDCAYACHASPPGVDDYCEAP